MKENLNCIEVNNVLNKLRREENITAGPLSQMLSDEGVVYVLINRRWKCERQMLLKITDLEDSISKESGFYIKEWIAEIFQKYSFSEYQSVPFPFWDVSKHNITKLLNR